LRGATFMAKMLVGIVAAYLVLLHAGIVRPPSLPHIASTKFLAFVAVLVGAALMVSATMVAMSTRTHTHMPVAVGQNRFLDRHVFPTRPTIALRIRALDGRAVGHLSSILKERAARTGLDYVVASLISDDGSDAILVIAGRRESEVRIESEILASLAATLRSFRVEPIEGEAGRQASMLLRLFRPRRREEPLVMLNAIGRAGFDASQADRGLYLGDSILTPTPTPVILRHRDIEGHAVILGSTGTGKSTTAAVIACRAWKSLGVKVIVLDWTGEYLDLLRGCKPRYIDPLSEGVGVWPTGSEGFNDDLLEVISTALDLTGPQAYMLQKVLGNARPKSIREIIENIEALPEESKWDKEVKRGLIRRIGILAERYPGIFTNSSKSLRLEDGIVIIDSSKIKITQARRAFTLLLLAADYIARREGEASERVLYIIDEAHNLIGGEFNFLAKLMAESRKYGMSFVLVTQSPLSIESILVNTSTKIIHALRGAREKSLVADALGLNRVQAETLGRLQPGEALVYAPSLGEPIFTRIRPVKPIAEGFHDFLV
jgi:DNA helicase HerA-like ATPase